MSLFNKTPLEEKKANCRKTSRKLAGAKTDLKNNTDPKKEKKLAKKYEIAKTNKRMADKEFDQELKNSSRTPSKKK